MAPLKIRVRAWPGVAWVRDARLATKLPRTLARLAAEQYGGRRPGPLTFGPRGRRGLRLRFWGRVEGATHDP